MSSRSIDITRVSFAVAVRIDPDDFWNAERILHTSAPLGDLARIREFEPVTCRDGRCHCPRGCR
ncbi:hypothetical protein [Parvibaculum sp.]|uniref:hypothetical protein n=1 Tax=Parvibaculum sp. TaxID=2024848 RepID=UPI00272A0365|nr:hypothetical protein [Parvibaculum sp.]